MIPKSQKLSMFVCTGKTASFRILWVVLGIVQVVWLISCSARQTHPPQSLLIFEHRIMGISQIHTAYPDASQVTLVTEFPSTNWYWLSPDGRSLAFLEDGEQDESYHLKILDIASGEIIGDLPQVGQTWSEHIPWQENVVWSPQGDRLVFLRSSKYGKEPDIFLYDLNAKEEMPLTNTKVVERSMAWSPDGQKIAFAFWNGCEQSSCTPEEMYWNIAIMDSNGSNQRTITGFPDLELLPADLWIASLCNLTWSSNARHIAFENECGELTGSTYWKEVFVTSVDSSELRRLTTFTDAYDLNSNTLPERAFKYSLHWLPDNNTLFIGYSSIAFTPDGRSHGGVLATIQNANLGTFVQATEGVMGSTARWSPNNEYVAWHTQGVNPDKYIVPGSTMVGLLLEKDHISMLNGQKTLPIGPCAKPGIYWSLDSNFAAYIANKSGASCGDAGVDQNIAIISLPDLAVNQITEPLGGDIQLIGWTFEFKE